MGKPEQPLTAAVNAREDACNAVRDVLRREYPVDGPIAWVRHGGKVSSGVVVDHLYADRIRVRNGATGKTYEVYAAEVARAEVFGK